MPPLQDGYHPERTGMNNSRASRVRNLPQLAHEAGYSVKSLAAAWGVSVRVLERFFLAAFGEPPRCHLKRLRMRRAIELLRDGSTVKETAARLGYEDPSHFSREFKNRYGFAPARYVAPPANLSDTPDLSYSAMNLARLAMKS